MTQILTQEQENTELESYRKPDGTIDYAAYHGVADPDGELTKHANIMREIIKDQIKLHPNGMRYYYRGTPGFDIAFKNPHHVDELFAQIPFDATAMTYCKIEVMEPMASDNRLATIAPTAPPAPLPPTSEPQQLLPLCKDIPLEQFEAWVLREADKHGGITNDVFNHMSEIADQPSITMEFLSALSFSSALVARSHVIKGRRTTHPNIYALNVAPPGYGKSTLLNAGKKLLTSVGEINGEPQFAIDGNGNPIGLNLHGKNLIRIENLTSGSAFFNALAQFPIGIAPIDEFGAFLRKMYGSRVATYQEELRTYILNSYSGSGSTLNSVLRSDAKIIQPITNPCLSIFGTTTHSDFNNAQKSSMFSEGFLPRFMMHFEDRKHGDLPEKPSVDSSQLVSAIRRFLEIRANEFMITNGNTCTTLEPGDMMEIILTPEQRTMVQGFTNRSRANQSSVISYRGTGGELFDRVTENGLKIALIIRATQDFHATTISDDLLRFGFHVAEYLAARVVRRYSNTMGSVSDADTINQERMDRIVTALERKGGSMTHRDLSRGIKGFTNRDYKPVIETMMSAEKISVKQEDVPGRHKRITY